MEKRTDISSFGTSTEQLEQEQKKLAKEVKLKGADLNEITSVGGCNITYINNSILVTIVVLNRKFEIIEEKFVMEKARFPYLPSFLFCRELPAVLKCWEKIENAPDALMINRNGILHPRKFGLASHLSFSINRPVVGISTELLCGEVKTGRVYLKDEIVGREVETKKGSRPVYVSPGNLISLNDSVELVKQFMKEPHKLPEPLDAASRYANRIKEEMLKGQ